MKRIIGLLLLLGCVFSLVGCGTSSVERIEIFPDSLSIVPGVSVQLTVEGYNEDGEQATEEQMENLVLCWEYRSDDNSFTVDEDGNLTAISEGIGNVMVKSKDGKLNSRAITVFVKENSK